MKYTAAVLDSRNQVIGLVFLDEKLRELDIAGRHTIDKTAVNLNTYKLSYSKKNINKAIFENVCSVRKIVPELNPDFYCFSHSHSDDDYDDDE